MPPWEKGDLPDAPAWRWRDWTYLIGPGLLGAGAAIGGGEWLMGPVNTGRYGGAVLWVTTLSIIAQVVYNIEISRYTLYTGEPIMNGKFRTFLGPMLWLGVYLLLDVGSFLPYQIASAATPVFAVIAGRMPDPASDRALLIFLMCAVFVIAALPLAFAGKIYSFIKGVMAVKVVVVFGSLSLLALLYSSAQTWMEILTGFFRFGTVPVRSGGTENLFASILSGRGLPDVDPGSVAALAAFAAIAGIGGLKNTMISSYTRDQGWGMGAQVGAISSRFGGRDIQLSHAGRIFLVTARALPRWRRWMRHVAREQIAVWMTGSLVGVALPAMLSVRFLPRGEQGDPWKMAALTAESIQREVGGALGLAWWYLLMTCALLVLVPNTISDADSTVRRWVDLAWSASGRLRKWDPLRINRFYFWALVSFVALGVATLLFLPRPRGLVEIYGCIANYALGFSCLHVLAVNLTLLPGELRPRWFSRIGLALSGIYFFALSAVTLAAEIRRGNEALGATALAAMVALLALQAFYFCRCPADRRPVG